MYSAQDFEPEEQVTWIYNTQKIPAEVIKTTPKRVEIRIPLLNEGYIEKKVTAKSLVKEEEAWLL